MYRPVGVVTPSGLEANDISGFDLRAPVAVVILLNPLFSTELGRIPSNVCACAAKQSHKTE